MERGREGPTGKPGIAAVDPPARSEDGGHGEPQIEHQSRGQGQDPGQGQSQRQGQTQNQTQAHESSRSQISWVTSQGTGRPGRPREVSEGKGAVFEHTRTASLKPTIRSSLTHFDPEPGFQLIESSIDGDSRGQTDVDIITVTCPGADPIQPWTSDPQYEPAPGTPPPTPVNIWVRHGILKKIPKTRVLMYRHRALADGLRLDDLAMDLLDQVLLIRQDLLKTQPSRPLFFFAHSIGGLVVKLALLKASLDDPMFQKYREIKYNCHGVGFFGTPHRGSSYLSRKDLEESICDLLGLHRPLPKSITNDLKNNNDWLGWLQEQFVVDLASELRIWSFCETIDSELSGSGVGHTSEVKYTAPLVSIKSALLEVREEDVYSLESDHAHLASFGPDNNTMNAFLEDLEIRVAKARRLSRHVHTPLRLKEKVKVEIVGFYEDPDTEADSLNRGVSTVRLYGTKTTLGGFLEDGPEPFLTQRLSKVSKVQKRRKNRRSSSSRPPILPDRSMDRSFAKPNIVISRAATFAQPLGRISSLSGEVSKPFLRPNVPDPLSLYPRPPSSESNSSVSTTMSEPVLPMDRTLQTKESFHSLTAGFNRPDPTERKFLWVHTPFTNPIWVKDIIHKLCETTHNEDLPAKLFGKEHWKSKQFQGLHSLSQPSYLKPSANLVYTETLPSSPFASPNPEGRAVPGPPPRCFYLYFPYLHFDTYLNVIRRRKLVEKRLSRGRASPVPQYVEDLESLEMKVIWEYIGFDPPLNSRRTLDQFALPSLRDTHARDDDQMLYKLTKQKPKKQKRPAGSSHWSRKDEGGDWPRRRSGSSKAPSMMESDGDSDEASDLDIDVDVRDGKILMVDQLWLWAIDTNTLATFFPYRHSSPKEGVLYQEADLRNSIYNELNGDLTDRSENAYDLAAFMVLHAVTVFIERSTHPDLDIFKIFEEAIGLLAERMTANMKRFRTQNFIGMGDDSSDDEYFGRSKAISIKKRHKRELEKAERENRENTSALLELRDLEDELNTLQRLFDIQEATILNMKALYTTPELVEITRNGQAYLDKSLEYMAENKGLTSEMLKRVDTTRKDYEKMLEMAQRQAQVDEVRWSRLQTELASSQNLSVMIFTTFTVIFLPLSFFTGLFGMNTIEWQDDEIPSIRYIGSIALPISIFLILFSLVVAFSSRVQGLFKALYKSIRRAFRAGKKVWVQHLEPGFRATRKERRMAEKKRQRREDRIRRQKERSYDFWGTVKGQQHEQHEIPDLNLNG